MKSFVQYVLCVIVLIAITYFFVPAFYGVNYPKPLGPEFDPAIRKVYEQKIDQTQPDIVLIGDSTAATNVDPVLLSAELNQKVDDISEVGAASTLWYLIIKNNIVTAKHKPAYLIILFRDSMLTTPDYRVQGSYFQQIDEFANNDDKLLIQLAFVNKMNWLEKLADQYLPPYGSRLKFRATIDGAMRKTAPRWLLQCEPACVDVALSKIFSADNFVSKIMSDAVNSANQYLYAPQNLDFEYQVDRSFLPEIIRLCKENNIRLILVRSKTFTFSAQSPAPRALDDYVNQFASYAARNDVPFIDLSDDPRLTRDLFLDPVHTNLTGRALFTHLLSELLAQYIR